MKRQNPERSHPILMMPPGVDKDRRRIRRMFAGIAGSYDLLNHLLSLNIDRSWRRAAARLLEPRPGERVLDLCTGTADLALELGRSIREVPGGAEEPGAAFIVGADFCLEMLRIGERKRRLRMGTAPGAAIRLAAADALRLPFAASSFDAASVAFGVRNFQDLGAGLAEIHRVLRPGGRLALLEFTTPARPWFRAIFGVYFHRILPFIGSWIARSRDPVASRAYSYLPASVREFPDADSLGKVMAGAGFARVRFHRLSLGVACVHLGERPAAPAPGAEA